MKETKGTHCPKCKRDIGIWAVMKAAWPTLLKCPHCKTKLVYKPVGWLLLAIFSSVYFSVLGILITAISRSFTIPTNTKLIALVLIAAILWQPFDYFFVVRLRKYHTLNIK